MAALTELCVLCMCGPHVLCRLSLEAGTSTLSMGMQHSKGEHQHTSQGKPELQLPAFFRHMS